MALFSRPDVQNKDINVTANTQRAGPLHCSVTWRSWLSKHLIILLSGWCSLGGGQALFFGACDDALTVVSSPCWTESCSSSCELLFWNVGRNERLHQDVRPRKQHGLPPRWSLFGLKPADLQLWLLRSTLRAAAMGVPAGFPVLMINVHSVGSVIPPRALVAACSSALQPLPSTFTVNSTYYHLGNISLRQNTSF